MSTISDSNHATVPARWLDQLRQSSHPAAVVFLLVFRLGALLTYLFGLLFIQNLCVRRIEKGGPVQQFRLTSFSVFIFILVILLLAADFWNVKNISGRLLVGLRWWNETSEAGESVWVFETADPQRYINPIDSKVFWFMLYICPAAWVGLGVLAVLKFEFFWLILIGKAADDKDIVIVCLLVGLTLILGIALILTITNAMAFSRCDKFSRANAVAGNLFSSGIVGSIVSKLIGNRLF